ncbi:hypothetical protein [Brucella anthropi]|nr:hypothetical protein [Brucella anthropi]
MFEVAGGILLAIAIVFVVLACVRNIGALLVAGCAGFLIFSVLEFLAR